MKRTQTFCGLLLVILVLSGCQTTASSQLAESKNSGFMSLWSAYTDCKATANLDQASSDLRQLRSASQPSSDQEDFVLPLPANLSRLVSNPASRVAVDVQAMVASCALHTGELALNQGYEDLAREFLTSVVTLHSEEHSYYAIRAKTLLAKIAQGVNISFAARSYQ